MAVQLITQAVKRAFHEQKHLEGQKQLNDWLCPANNVSDNAAIDMDELDVDPFAVSAIDRGGVAQTVLYEPGSTQQFTPEVSSRQTPITPVMRDQSVVGLPPTSPIKKMLIEKARQIVTAHLNGFKVKDIKQALELLISGTQTYYDELGNVKSTIDFGRDPALSTTADFSSVTMDAALTANITLLENRGADVSELVCIMGSSWLKEYQKDSRIQAKQQNNPQNVLIKSEGSPRSYKGVKGLRFIGSYLPEGSSVSVTILAYSPGTLYRAKKGDVGEAFLGATKMVMFSEAELGTTFHRGFEVISNAGKLVTVSGGIAFDGFIDKMNRNEYVRSTGRVMYGMPSINHTLCNTGSNFN